MTGSETVKTGGIASPVQQAGNWSAVAVKSALYAGFVKADGIAGLVAEHAGTEASGVAGYVHVEAVNAGTVMCTGAQHAGMAAAAGNLRSAKTEALDAGDVEEAGPEQVGVEKAGIYESPFGIF